MGKLLTVEAPLQLLPTLACRLGVNEAIALQQLHYHLRKEEKKQPAPATMQVKKTYKQWHQDFPFWSLRTIRRTLLQLEQNNLVRSINSSSPYKKYTIDYKILQSMLPHVAKEQALLLAEPALQILPQLVCVLSIGKALVLQQIYYWMFCHKNLLWFQGQRWTAQRWPQQFPFWSKRTLNTLFQNLSQQGLIAGFYHRSQQRKYTTLNQEAVKKLCDQASLQCTLSFSMLETPPSTKATEVAKSAQANLDQNIDQKEKIYQRVQDCPSFFQRSSATLATGWSNLQVSVAKIAYDPGQICRSYIEERIKEKERDHPPPQGNAEGVSRVQEDEEDFSSFLNIWNKLVQKNLPGNTKTAAITATRLEKLKFFCQSQSCEPVGEWRKYCETISGCRFLMGGALSGFRVTLDWALNPENKVKVEEGVIYDNPSASKLSAFQKDDTSAAWKEFQEGLVHQSDMWKAVVAELAHNIGKDVFLSWFGSMEVVESLSDSLILATANSFTRSHVTGHFLSLMEKIVRQKGCGLKEVKIILKKNKKGS